MTPEKVKTDIPARLRDLSSQDELLSDTKDLSADSIGMLEDSMDGGPPSVNSDIATTSSPAPSIASTPVSTKTRTKQNKSRIITGYILFSSEMRKAICQSNQGSTFGEISRMVGTDWKKLPASVKQAWEEKAAKCTKDHSTAAAIIDEIHECLWDKCDLQFEDALDCMEHCIQEGTGHVQKSYADKTGEIEYHCMWRNCVRVRKNLGAFPHLTRLIKHVREVHLLKGGKNVSIDKTKKLVHRKNPAPSTPAASATPQAAQATPQPMQQQSGIPITQSVQNSAEMPTYQSLTVVQPIAPPEPMFVTVPPRPQRVLHSEAYIKYIEGLQNNTPHISPYEKTIRATQATAPSVDTSKLPGQWLGRHAQEKPEEVVNALWHLRNFLLKDVLEIKRQHF